MDKDKLDLYESLIRASLALIFVVALSVAVLGVIAISQMFLRQAIPAPSFLYTDSVSESHNRRA